MSVPALGAKNRAILSAKAPAYEEIYTTWRNSGGTESSADKNHFIQPH